jgi:anti-anti-sigma regulatory factor
MLPASCRGRRDAGRALRCPIAERTVTEGDPMPSSVLDTRTSADGSVVVRPHGVVDADGAVELQQLLVHTVRRVRPLRLILDLTDVIDMDPINLGTLAAACQLGDDYQVIIFVDNPGAVIAAQLAAAGVPCQRLRSTAAQH